MNPIPLFQRIPPIPVLIGAAFAFASYLTTNVWRAHNDDQIKSYQEIIDRAGFFESQSSSLPRFQAASDYSFQQYLFSQQQRNAIYDASAALGHKIGVSFYSRTRNPQDARAIARESGMLVNFFDTLPKDVSDQSIIQKSHLFVYGASAASSVPLCIKNIWVSDHEIDQSLQKQYDTQFAELYQKRSTDNRESDDYPPTILAANVSLKTKLNIQNLATEDIAKLPLPTINSTTHPSEALKDDVAEGTPAAREIFANHQFSAVRCIEHARDDVLDHYFYLLIETRRVVSQQLMEPLADSNRNLGRLEVGLYVISAIVALFATAPGRPDKSPGRQHVGALRERIIMSKVKPLRKRRRRDP